MSKASKAAADTVQNLMFAAEDLLDSAARIARPHGYETAEKINRLETSIRLRRHAIEDRGDLK